MKLFGSSGIRGLVNVEITPFLAQSIGAALASQFEGGAIIVGRDTRVSGAMLESSLFSAITSCGLVVGSLGVVPTPVVAWTTREMQAEAGVAITASHNPPAYNGFKIFDTSGMAYTEEKQSGIENVIKAGEFQRSSWNRVGQVETMDAGRLYVDAMLQYVTFSKEWKVVCDLYNGATCSIAPFLYDEVGCISTMINAQPDGNFPAGNPEPDNTSLKRLGKIVRAKGADIGFGFDGDGDRMMAVDEKGKVPSPDRVLAAYARHIVAKNGGGVVVTHVGASMSVEEAVEDVGGEVIRTKVGDVYITEAMMENGAVFGGEPVGAWVHPDVHMCPDGILSALRLILALETDDKTLSQFLADVPEYPTMRTKVECPSPQKPGAMDMISSECEGMFNGVTGISTVDGVRIELDDGWVLIRPSGTEPLIRITVEAKEQGRAEELLETGRLFVHDVTERIS